MWYLSLHSNIEIAREAFYDILSLSLFSLSMPVSFFLPIRSFIFCFFFNLAEDVQNFIRGLKRENLFKNNQEKFYESFTKENFFST